MNRQTNHKLALQLCRRAVRFPRTQVVPSPTPTSEAARPQLDATEPVRSLMRSNAQGNGHAAFGASVLATGLDEAATRRMFIWQIDFKM